MGYALWRPPVATVVNYSPSPLPELLEWDAVRESLPADSDAFQHAVTPQRLQHQVGVHLPSLINSKINSGLKTTESHVRSLTYPFLMVGDDATDKVGLSVVQGGHQFAQRLLVQLTHRTEHALLGFGGP